MNQTLNDEQRKLVEDNHNLIYSFLERRNLSLDAIEDWYGTAAIGLCKAAMVYDENRGCKFSTLSYIIMDNEVKRTMRDNRKCVSDTFSLDAPVEEVDDITYSDTILDSNDLEYSACINDAINTALRSLSDRDRGIIEMIVDYGMKYEEIANRLKMTRANVSRIYKKFLDKIKAYFND